MPETDALKVAWDHVEQSFGDDKRHQAFIELAIAENKLAYAAGCYRRMLSVKPGDSPYRISAFDPLEQETIAKKQMDRITAIAIAMLQSTKTELRPETKRRLNALAFVFALVALLVIAFVARKIFGR